MTTNQKKIAALAALGLLWGGIACLGMAGRGRARACAADECEWPCFRHPGTPWNSRWVARAARSPRSCADSTGDDLHASTQYLCTASALMTRWLPAQTSQSSILGPGRRCFNRRLLPDWPNSTISALCAWRKGGGRRAKWLCSRRMTISMSSELEKQWRVTSW